jgi:hypothetical protein
MTNCRIYFPEATNQLVANNIAVDTKLLPGEPGSVYVPSTAIGVVPAGCMPTTAKRALPQSSMETPVAQRMDYDGSIPRQIIRGRSRMQQRDMQENAVSSNSENIWIDVIPSMPSTPPPAPANTSSNSPGSTQ